MKYDKHLQGLNKAYTQLENDIILDIIRRIKKYGYITRTADYQINRLKTLGITSSEIEDLLMRRLNLTYPQIFEMYDDVIQSGYARDLKIYEQINEDYPSFNKNKELQLRLLALKKQTKNEFENIARMTGFTINRGGQITFLPLHKYIIKEFDRAIIDIYSGAFSYDEILKRVTQQMTYRGLTVIDYDTGTIASLQVALSRVS